MAEASKCCTIRLLEKREPMCQRCDDLRNKIQKFQYFVDQFDVETTQRLKAGIDELEAEKATLHREEEESYAD
jgi:hypothetical protein